MQVGHHVLWTYQSATGKKKKKKPPACSLLGADKLSPRTLMEAPRDLFPQLLLGSKSVLQLINSSGGMSMPPGNGFEETSN